MKDQIMIRDLRLRTVIGVHDYERVGPREVLANVVLYTDTRTAGASDRIEDTIDYSEVSKRIVALAERSSFLLVEKLAEEIAALCLEDPRVKRVGVTLEKPGAVRFSRSVGVHIERTHKHWEAGVESEA
ncbi:MAG: dihydroneopterin aldolase [Anaerolineae bacterium]